MYPPPGNAGRSTDESVRPGLVSLQVVAQQPKETQVLRTTHWYPDFAANAAMGELRLAPSESSAFRQTFLIAKPGSRSDSRRPAFLG